MTPISELGLEVIKLEDQVLLVDKLEHTNVRLILHQSINGKVNHFYKSDEIDLEDYNKRRFLGLTFNVVASTKPLEGLPLLVIEDEVEKLARNHSVDRFKKSDNQRYFNQTSCEIDFIEGHNKAKETYKFTEEDMKLAWQAGCKAILNRGTAFFEEFIADVKKKELWIEVEVDEESERLYHEDVNYKGWTSLEIEYIFKNPFIIKAVWK